MNVPAKLGAFGVGLIALFAAAFSVGAAAGPVDEPASPKHGGGQASAGAEGAGSEEDDMMTMDHAEAAPGGLEVSSAGYTLVPAATTLEAGATTEFAFRIDGPDGEPVTDFDREHDKELHLIVVRRDTSGYQHVHPLRDSSGTWRTELDLSRPGTYRALADFTARRSAGLTLGVDFQVPGNARPTPLPPASGTATVDGYTVGLEGELRPGKDSGLSLSVSRSGRPVTDLEPYLAAYGHLVALRVGDLAYLHVHPEGAPGDGTTAPGPSVEFRAHVPSAGTYRLYLDFKHGGAVRTAEFTVEAQPAGGSAGSQAESHTEEGHGS